jgi:tRNA(Ile)-lysidine synthetase-like protein
LLPALENADHGGARSGLLAVQRAAELVDQCIAELAKATLEGASNGLNVMDRNALLSWPEELRTEILRYAARANGVRLTRRAATSAARDLGWLRSGHRIDLGGGLCLERSFDRLVLRRGQVPVGRVAELAIHGTRDGESTLSLGRREYAVRWGSGVVPSRGAARVALSLHGDHYPLKVRSWEAGDRIRLPGGSRKLKRVFGDARVPVSVRHSIPVVADSGGRVLWVAGVARCSEPGMATNNELVIEIEDA